MPPSALEPLTFEQTRGTKTFYFPVDREPGQPPRVTIMLKRASDGALHAGVAVCSQEDNFARRTGRRIAFHRMLGRPLVAVNSEELVNLLVDRLLVIVAHRPELLGRDTFHDLGLLSGVEAAFDMLDANRRAHREAAAHELEVTGC